MKKWFSAAKDGFKVVRVKDWESAREMAISLDGWIFRGQADASWNLESTIFRGSFISGYHPHFIAVREQEILYDFQRRAHHFIADPPPLDAYLEWLALIQHYGGPTRLLDFSRSFYIASFFAVENATTDAAIWGINGFMLADAAGAKLGFTTFGSEKMVIRANAARVEKLLRKARPPASVLDVEPERQNERLSIQQGLFVMPCNLDRPFEANLGATFRFRRHLIQNQQPEPWSLKIESLVRQRNRLPVLKIVLPRKCILDAIHDLRRMNITSASLFPGLDGFARSLRYHLLPPNQSLRFWIRNQK